MLAKRIVPCLDVKDGKVVKGINFAGLREVGDPVGMGAAYSAEGADELVYLDISASLEGRRTFTGLVSRMAGCIDIPFTVGGGISSFDDAARLLDAGADKISINTAAVRDPSLVTRIASRYGSQFVVVAIDARQFPRPEEGSSAGGICAPAGGETLRGQACPAGGNFSAGGVCAPADGGDPQGCKFAAGSLFGREGPSGEKDSSGGRAAPAGRWQVMTHGGKMATDKELHAWAKEVQERGAGEILFTSMDHDGTRNGYAVEACARLAEALSIPVIASGGAGTPRHIIEVLTRGKADAALAASIFHDGQIRIPELKRQLAAAGVPVRPEIPPRMF